MLTWSGPVSTPPIIRKLKTGATYHFLISSPPFFVHSAYAFLMNANYNSSKYLLKTTCALTYSFSCICYRSRVVEIQWTVENKGHWGHGNDILRSTSANRQAKRFKKKKFIASTSLASWSSPTALSNKFEIRVHYSQ